MSKGTVVQFPRRAWKAGRVDLLRSGWPMHSRPPDADIRHALSAVRARSRHEAQNNDHARAFLREVKSNVVGPHGVVLQSRARMANGKPDRRSREVLEEGWREWGEQCEVTGRLSWADEQRRAIETVARDGEAVYRLVTGWDNEHGFALQAIDPERLCVNFNTQLPNGNHVVMGVELDSWGRHLNYYLEDEDAQHLSYRSNKRMVPVPASEIVLLHLPEWVSQTRGVPWMATALRRMNDLDGYDESAVVAARAGASKHGHYKASEDAEPLQRDDGDQQLGPADGQHGGGKIEGQFFAEFEPGVNGILPPGWDYEFTDPKYPHAEHGSFTKTVLRGICAGLGVGYNQLSGDLEGVNYSSLREGRLVQTAVWMMLQEWLITSFHQPVYRAWLRTSLGIGALVDPRARPLDLRREREFRRVFWQPRRWQWVDPLKEALAAEKLVNLRVRTPASIIRERGEDPGEVWTEFGENLKQMEEHGVPLPEAAVTNVTLNLDADDDDNAPDPEEG
jgi:lambda family phage portal protein